MFMTAKQYANYFIDVDSFRSGYCDHLHKLFPEVSYDDILEVFNENYENYDVNIKNSVRGQNYDIKAMKLLHSVYDRPYILFEDGNMYINQNEDISPTLKCEDKLFHLRKSNKKLANYYLTEGDDPVLGKLYDLIQSTVKVLMNSFYGLMILRTSKFYNPDLASSITVRGRSSVAITAMTLESVLYGYHPKKYESLVYYINEVCEQDYKHYDLIHNDYLSKHKEDDINKLLLNHIGITEDYYMYNAIVDRIKRLHFTDKVKLLYKNNMNRFINVPEVKSQIKTIANLSDTGKCVMTKLTGYNGDGFYCEYSNYNKDAIYSLSKSGNLSETDLDIVDVTELYNGLLKIAGADESKVGYYLIDISTVFINPYKPHQSYGDNIKILKEYIEEILTGYVTYKDDYIDYLDILTANQQDLIKNIRRKAVLLIDTDSNFVYLGEMNNKLNEMLSFNNLIKDEKWFTLSNISTILSTHAVDTALERYKEHIHLLDEYRPGMTFKNEFLFRLVYLTSRKKNYMGPQKLKEGGVFKKDKIDIKGLSFTKSNFNQTISEKVQNIVEEEMMRVDINVPNILKKIYDIHNDIAKVIRTDDALDYLAVIKTKDDIDNLKASDYRVTAAELWNFLALDKPIELPGAFYVCHIDMTDDGAVLEKYPDVYNKMVEFCITNNAYKNKRRVMDVLETIRKYNDENSTVYDDELDVDLEELQNIFSIIPLYEEDDSTVRIGLSLNSEDALGKQVLIDIFNTLIKAFTKLYKKIDVTSSTITVYKDSLIKPKNRPHKTIFLETILQVYTSNSKECMNYCLDQIKANFDKSNYTEVFMTTFYENSKMTPQQVEYAIWNKKLSASSQTPSKLRMIGIPLDAITLPDFIKDFIDDNKLLSVAPNLLAPVMEPLHIVTYRSSDSSSQVTNIIDYY